jgi:hypothetical protein
MCEPWFEGFGPKPRRPLHQPTTQPTFSTITRGRAQPAAALVPSSLSLHPFLFLFPLTRHRLTSGQAFVDRAFPCRPRDPNFCALFFFFFFHARQVVTRIENVEQPSRAEEMSNAPKWWHLANNYQEWRGEADAGELGQTMYGIHSATPPVRIRIHTDRPTDRAEGKKEGKGQCSDDRCSVYLCLQTYKNESQAKTKAHIWSMIFGDMCAACSTLAFWLT